MPEQFYNVASYLARDSVGYLVRRLYSILTARIETSFADHDFTLMQWSVLMHLRDGLARTASDLACAFQHDSGALTRVIDKLERRGLLRRHRSSCDRRVVELELTPAGHEVIAALLPTVVDEMNAALEPLGRAEFEQFRGVLVRVLDHLQQARPATVAPVAAPKSPAKSRTRTRTSKKSVARRKTGRRP